MRHSEGTCRRIAPFQVLLVKHVTGHRPTDTAASRAARTGTGVACRIRPHGESPGENLDVRPRLVVTVFLQQVNRQMYMRRATIRMAVAGLAAAWSAGFVLLEPLFHRFCGW